MQLTIVDNMERRTFEDVPCSIARTLDVIGDWWAPLIVRECLYGLSKFDEIQNALGIGRNILTRRLHKLIEQGVVEKRAYQDRPPRYTYTLTDKGYEVARVLMAMMPFGDRWQFDRGQDPIRLYDRRTGKRVRPVVVDQATGEELDVRQLFAGPGPGFPPSRAARRQRFPEYYARKKRRR